MKIPKRIEKLISRRASLAARLMVVDSDLSEWIDKNEIEVAEYDYQTGCEMYCNPYASAERIRKAIERKE